MGVLFSLAAALGYGVSDFVGGIAARRTSAWPVALASGIGGLLGAVLLAVAFPGTPRTEHLLWGVVAGLGSGAGTGFLYRGFAAGRMGVVAPVSAVGAALLPVAIGVLTGERPAVLVWVGIAAALPGIWLVAREPGAADPLSAAGPAAPGSAARGVLDGLLAGLGFGLLFVALGQVPEGAGYWPLAVTQSVSMATVIALALGFGAPWRLSSTSATWGILAGLVGSSAVLFFLLASQTGLLTVAAILTSLYPAVTVLLAAVVLREHLYRPQLLGLAFCGVAVALVAAG